MAEITERPMFFLQEIGNWTKGNIPVLLEELDYAGLNETQAVIAREALEKFIDSLHEGTNTSFLKVLAQKEIRTALAAV